MFRRSFIAMILPLTACAGDDDGACERAAAHVAACFPDQATIATCDPETADAVASASCEELASWDGKADNPWCAWMPWLCGGTTGGTGKKIEIAVEECGPGSLCPYVTSAPCGLVTLRDADGDEVARGLTSGGGRLTFSGLPSGTYTIEVHQRNGALARMMASDYSDQTTPARRVISLSSGETPWARFYLEAGTSASLTRCADLRGEVTFTDAGGTPLDRREAEWSWIVELESDGAVEHTRPLFSYPDSNLVSFRLVRQGAHVLRYVRMNIPSYERRNNPDYARLRRLYSTAAQLELDLEVRSTQLGRTIDVSRRVVDPLAP